MTTLLVGFDSAWTPNHSGALVGVLQADDGTFQCLGVPEIVNFCEAEGVILNWQNEYRPIVTTVLLDQPTIVMNASGQRPVENIVSSPVSRRYGGMQPANTGKEEMFSARAPIWRFLNRFGGPADPVAPVAETGVFETYPVLAIIALGWTLPDSRRPAGRLPKYNPERKTFSHSDWQFVCGQVSAAFRDRGLMGLVRWINEAQKTSPSKSDQDRLDACVCLLVAVYMAERKACLMVGDCQTGYIVVPHSDELRVELNNRCSQTGRAASDWVRTFKPDCFQLTIDTGRAVRCASAGSESD